MPYVHGLQRIRTYCLSLSRSTSSIRSNQTAQLGTFFSVLGCALSSGLNSLSCLHLLGEPKGVVLRASELAACSGYNRYQSQAKALQKVWSYHDPQGFLEAYNRNGMVLDELFVQQLAQENAAVQRVLASAYQNTSQPAAAMKDARDQLSQVPELEPAVRELVMQQLQEAVYKQYGTDAEEEAARRIPGIVKDPRLHRLDMGLLPGRLQVPWCISGKVDALTADHREVIEIKNRVRGLAHRLHPYEEVQVQAYLQLLDLQRGWLVERWQDDMAVHPVLRDDAMWSLLRSRLEAFGCALLALMRTPRLQDEFLTAPGEAERAGLLPVLADAWQAGGPEGDGDGLIDGPGGQAAAVPVCPS